MLGSQVKEYNAPSHSKGGQNIDANGNPTTNGIAEIEKKETLISEGMDKKYVMSDYLGTSKRLKEQLSKVKGSDPISRATRQHIFDKFKRLNEARKTKAVFENNNTKDIDNKMTYGGRFGVTGLTSFNDAWKARFIKDSRELNLKDGILGEINPLVSSCLLYTSDAADD